MPTACNSVRDIPAVSSVRISLTLVSRRIPRDEGTAFTSGLIQPYIPEKRVYVALGVLQLEQLACIILLLLSTTVCRFALRDLSESATLSPRIIEPPSYPSRMVLHLCMHLPYMRSACSRVSAHPITQQPILPAGL